MSVKQLTSLSVCELRQWVETLPSLSLSSKHAIVEYIDECQISGSIVVAYFQAQRKSTSENAFFAGEDASAFLTMVGDRHRREMRARLELKLKKVKPSKTCSVNIFGLGNERMALSLMDAGHITVAELRQRVCASLMTDDTQLQNIQLMYHGNHLANNKTLAFYGIGGSASTAVDIHLRYAFCGGSTKKQYYAGVVNKVRFGKSYHEIHLDLSDVQSLPALITNKNISLRYYQNRTITYNEKNKIEILIKQWIKNKNQLSFSLNLTLEKCEIEGQLAKLYKSICNSNKNPFFIFNDGGDINYNNMNNRNNNSNGNPLRWTCNDVKVWIQSFGNPLSQYDFGRFEGMDGMELFSLSADEINRKMLYRSYSVNFQKEMKLVINQARVNVCSGVIPLQNQGNTCYMNSSIQVLLQTPSLVQFLRDYASSNTTYPVTLLDAFAKLAKNAVRGASSAATLSDIRRILSGINPRFGTGAQDDSSVVLATILVELDRNCATVFANGMEETIDERFAASYSETVDKELDEDEEEFFIEEILAAHNPFESVVRQVMDGVEKITTTCLTCNKYKTFRYSTFREIQVPLIDHQMTVAVRVCIPSLKHTFDKEYQVLSYCSIDVLRVQIAADIEQKQECKSLPNVRQNLECVTIAAMYSGSANATNIDKWMHFYNTNDLCSDIPTKVFAIVNSSCSQPQRKLNNSCNNTNNNSNGHQNQTMKYLMEYEIVINNNGTICSVLPGAQTKFFPLDEGKKYLGLDLLQNCREGSELERKANYDFSIFLDNQFIQPFRQYTISKGMHIIVLVWTPLSVVDKVWPKSYNGDNMCEKLKQFLSVYLDELGRWKSATPLNNIEKALALYEQEKILDDQRGTFNCANVCKCEAHVFREQKQIVFWPRNLILLIDRYERSSAGKSMHMVRYPVTKPLVVGHTAKQKYQLFATCNHSSGADQLNNHYTANVKSINTKEWYSTSDSSVEKIDTNSVMDRDAIVLLFTKLSK